MTFRDENTDEHILYRKVSEDGKVEIGVHPVLYGFRIRAGSAGDMFYDLDYCAGDKLVAVETLYGIVLTVLKDRLSKGKPPFRGFPIQERKPMYNDPECAAKLFEMCAGLEMEQVSCPLLNEMKTDYILKMFNKKKS